MLVKEGGSCFVSVPQTAVFRWKVVMGNAELSNPVKGGMVARANRTITMSWAVGIKHHWCTATFVETECHKASSDDKLVVNVRETEHKVLSMAGTKKSIAQRGPRDSQSHHGWQSRIRTGEDSCSSCHRTAVLDTNGENTGSMAGQQVPMSGNGAKAKIMNCWRSGASQQLVRGHIWNYCHWSQLVKGTPTCVGCITVLADVVGGQALRRS